MLSLLRNRLIRDHKEEKKVKCENCMEEMELRKAKWICIKCGYIIPCCQP